MAGDFEATFFAWQDRVGHEVANLLARFPDRRHHIACGVLGAAIGVADTIGVDVPGFLAHLRSQHAKPDVLVPPQQPPTGGT